MRMPDPAALPLRDVHAVAPPPWWPPAPGWWFVAALLLVVLGVVGSIRWRRRRRRRAMLAIFDAALAARASPSEEVAAISELLRRSARLRDPQADRLQGDEWLAFLDAGTAEPVFSGTALGRLLVEGPFQREVDENLVARLRLAARQRYLGWLR